MWIKLLLFVIVVGGLGIFAFLRREALAKFFAEVRFETSKVSWPEMDEVINSTILVLVVTAILGVMFLITDTFFAAVVKTLING